MATYVAALRADSKFLWWTHTAALLIFLPLIPHTKHLHLVLSPFSIFLSRGSFAKIPPLANDDDFGLDTGKDLTQIAALQGLFVRRVRPLHRALSGQQHQQDSRSQEDRSRRPRLSERVRSRLR
jgi:hypothetical protein